jgi:TatD DNase family protein
MIPAMPVLKPGLFDAHNHLQDARFDLRADELLACAAQAGVTRMVVNGVSETDWPHVAALARRHPEQVQPSFGYHPWFLGERTPDWERNWVRWLDTTPHAAVGEIGLDRWMLEQPERWRARCFGSNSGPLREPPAWAEQEAVFVRQLSLAAERNLPASIHCLYAFGPLRDLLTKHPHPACGFLLHSYSGPVELVPALARLGAYFSFSGYFLSEAKLRQRTVFLAIPPDRLLVETDAPDQLPPKIYTQHPLADARTGQSLNHPANLAAIYAGLAGVLGESEAGLTARVAENFHRLFSGLR